MWGSLGQACSFLTPTLLLKSYFNWKLLHLGAHLVFSQLGISLGQKGQKFLVSEPFELVIVKWNGITIKPACQDLMSEF